MSVAMLGQFFLSLSILIVLHECGHFFPARWFNTRVEKFYLFFDPWFELFKKKIGDTEYGIGWLPLGGYVKISGMVDESMDTEQMKSPPQPWEFRSKKAWQRLIIMLGGVTVNFILGFLIFGLMAWHYGEDYVPASEAKFGIHADSLGQHIGLRTGDKILMVGNTPFEKFDDRQVLRGIVFDGARTLTVERAGARTTFELPTDIVGNLTKFSNKDNDLFHLRLPPVVGEVVKGQAAEKAGLQTNDRVLAVNGEPVFFDEFRKKIVGSKNQPLTVNILRGSDSLNLALTPNEMGKIGIGFVTEFKKLGFNVAHKSYTLSEAMPLGVSRGWDFLVNQVKAFGKMFRGEIKASESVGGFKSIAKMFAPEWDWRQFWAMTGSLSLILGFMNLLPIPALDGGYVVFLLWEVITGKRVSDTIVEKAVQAGFFFLMILIVVINFWDIIR
ncbi:MAG: RIP metalloprotease RseP [Saprospiraceae bacterium]|nr:RIP metalloprotease RseP [Saprospiraceae bacterium]